MHVATLCFINYREKICLCSCYYTDKECGFLPDPHSGHVSRVSLSDVNTSDPEFTPQPLTHSPSLWPQVKAKRRLTCCLHSCLVSLEWDVWRLDSSAPAWTMLGQELGPGSQRVKNDRGEFQGEFCIPGLIKFNCVWMRENYISVICVGYLSFINLHVSQRYKTIAQSYKNQTKKNEIQRTLLYLQNYIKSIINTSSNPPQRWVCSTSGAPLDIHSIHLRQSKSKYLQGANNIHDISHFLIYWIHWSSHAGTCLMSNTELMTSRQSTARSQKNCGIIKKTMYILT